MPDIQISDELQQLIDSKVRDGRAESTVAYVETAIRLLLEDDESDATDPDEISKIVTAGIADMEAGRYITIANKEDERRFHEDLMGRVAARLKSGQ